MGEAGRLQAGYGLLSLSQPSSTRIELDMIHSYWGYERPFAWYCGGFWLLFAADGVLPCLVNVAIEAPQSSNGAVYAPCRA